MNKTAAQQKILLGIAIGRGIAIGEPFFFEAAPPTMIFERVLDKKLIMKEVKRYRSALANCKKEIEGLCAKMQEKNILEAATILETHLQIIEDPLLNVEVEAQIIAKQRNAEYVFQFLVDSYQKRFEGISDPFFRERSQDLKDLSRRIIGYLTGYEYVSLADVSPGAIVFARELSASDIAEARVGNVRAFVTEGGGVTSHAAIVAKANGFPYVANVQFEPATVLNASQVIVDANKGKVIIDPEPTTLFTYRLLEKELELHHRKLERTSSLETKTRDNHPITLMANVEMVNEIDLVERFGGAGIGLFRSEYLFLLKQNFPTEEEQVAIYRHIAERLKGYPVIIRTFDIGGDKLTDEQTRKHKGNPYLGCRAIRFLLQEKLIFKTQLRAILRASAYGDVRVLFPMITCLPELIEAKKILAEARAELEKEGVKLPKKHIPLGCMIEVPSAAMITDLIAKECDFLSLGTNDLIQYSLAADRSNEAMSVIYTPTDPGVLRLINSSIIMAKEANVPIGVCGEIAGDPLFTALLLGMGIRELSVSARQIPLVKNAIRNLSLDEAKNLFTSISKLTTSEEIRNLLVEHYKDHVPEDVRYAARI